MKLGAPKLRKTRAREAEQFAARIAQVFEFSEEGEQFRTETTKGFDGAGSDTRTIFQQFVVGSHGVGVVVTKGRTSEVGIRGRMRNNDVQPPSLVGVRAPNFHVRGGVPMEVGLSRGRGGQSRVGARAEQGVNGLDEGLAARLASGPGQ